MPLRIFHPTMQVVIFVWKAFHFTCQYFVSQKYALVSLFYPVLHIAVKYNYEKGKRASKLPCFPYEHWSKFMYTLPELIVEEKRIQ